MDDAKPQRMLDVVHPDASQQTGGWPFSVVLDDEQLQNAANGGLYQLSSPANPLHAPAELEFDWSDGHVEVTKHFRFDDSYVVHVETAGKVNGRPITAGLGWLRGFGDLTVTNPVPIETVNTYYSEGGKITNYQYKKLEGLDKWNPGSWQGGKDFVGIEDRYFTAAFLPANGATPGALETRYWKTSRTFQVNGQDTQEPVPQVAAAAPAQPLALRVYVGPKDYDDLKKMNPPLNGLVNFGWLEFIAEPLFHGLKWLHKYIPNWGWAIVALTLIINMLLFPLRISSYKTTIKMQRVAPEVKAIQERYKKYKLNDPKKAEMNKEVMAVYSREGINPGGGCIQQPCGHRAAGVFEPEASFAGGACKARAREKIVTKSFPEANARRSIRKPHGPGTHSRWQAGPASHRRGAAAFSGKYCARCGAGVESERAPRFR